MIIIYNISLISYQILNFYLFFLKFKELLINFLIKHKLIKILHITTIFNIFQLKYYIDYL